MPKTQAGPALQVFDNIRKYLF